MKIRMRGVALLLACAFAIPAIAAKPGVPIPHVVTPAQVSLAATSGIVWNQDYVVTNSDDITQYVQANDFVLSQAQTLTAFSVILSDDAVNDNGLLDSFSGTLSWAIYTDAAGAPGTLIASGEDSSIQLTDTGVQDDFSADLVRADAGFTPPVSLAAGRYWLALHENAWLSPSDGSVIWWEWSSGVVGNEAVHADDETAPANWAPYGSEPDNAFTLYASVATVPTLDPRMLALLAGLIGVSAVLALRR